MFEKLFEFFSSSGFMPHIHCYLDKPSLVWTMAITDTLIGLAYISISVTLLGLVRKIKISFSFVVLCFGIFIAACGGTHFMEVYTLWVPEYWSSAFLKVVTALASVGTGVYLYRLRSPLIQVAEAAKLSEQRRLDLETLTNTLEHSVEVRTKELKEALQVRDDFLSVASHELRTPITVIKLKAELNRRLIAQETPEVAEKVSKYNFELENQVDRLTRLVEDMLDISRARAGSISLVPERIDLSAILAFTFERLAQTLEKNQVKLKTKIDSELVLFGDQLRLEQVFSNLIGNVCRYAPQSTLLVTAHTRANAIEIIFEDNGPGIAEEASQRIFERFERLSPRDHSGGLGVGLYLSRAIIKSHRGTIELDTSFKMGARFVIILPAFDSESSLDPCVSLTQT